jgi:hypothetical protein
MIISRRSVIAAGLLGIGPNLDAKADLISPLLIEVRRSKSLADLTGNSDCLPGELYLVSDFNNFDPGTYICDTIELPWKNDARNISAIAVGTYNGLVRADGERGWRIELDYPGKRTNIQIHTGNIVWQLLGCVLVGKISSHCNMLPGSSRPARDRLQRLYGNSAQRPIQVRFVETLR